MSDVEILVRDRDGDLYPHVEPEPEQCTCSGTGWSEQDSEGRPKPCLVCRPHLRGAYGPSKAFGFPRFAVR